MREEDLWLVAMDFCDVLDIKNPTRTLDGLDDDEKGLHTMKTLGGTQEMSIVSEPGLYSLIGKSRKPEPLNNMPRFSRFMSPTRPETLSEPSNNQKARHARQSANMTGLFIYTKQLMRRNTHEVHTAI